MDDPHLLQTLTDFYQQYCVKTVNDQGETHVKGWEDNSMTYLLLGNLLIEGTDPHSALSRYFLRIQQDAKNLKKDRIYQALEQTRLMLYPE